MNRKALLSIKRLIECGEKVKEPRRTTGNYWHKLVDVLVITILAIISGCETWQEIKDYGKSKQEWLRSLLGFRYGTPSEATFRRIYQRISPECLENMYREWVTPYVGSCVRKQIGIDGKTVRGVAAGSGEWSHLHMLSAWVRDDGISLGQIAVDAKENEITAIPKLLNMLEVKGAVISIDAMGCQTAIAEKIVSRGADYVLAVKGNQPTLLREMDEYFQWAQTDETERKQLSEHVEDEWSHGRYYRRRTVATPAICWFASQRAWKKLHSFIMVERKRVGPDKTSLERHYYISSLEASGKEFARYIRGHWSIENNLHWMLDATFHEDKSLISTGHAPENLSILRKIALAFLKKDTGSRISVRRKIRLAAYDDLFALRLLSDSK